MHSKENEVHTVKGDTAADSEAAKKAIPTDVITVCICTYKRPLLLKKLLTALQHQLTSGLFAVSAVVVDNDCGQSARIAVVDLDRNSNVPIEYHVEPEQNISLARNKALEKVGGEYIAFIDDDEWPPHDWLLTLFTALKSSNADGVLGPVHAQYETEPPAWVVRGRFYEKRPPYPTGRVLDWTDTRTSNALVRKEALGTVRFDPRYGRGGEDRDLFRRLIGQGRMFIWCAEGAVFESIPPERMTRSFMIRRALLRGKMATVGECVKIIDIAKSLVAIATYTCALPVLLLIGHHIFMKYLVRNFDHIGKILALMGFDVVKQKYVMQ